eukprot:TRINITY_DN8227_c0_g1_i2.p1 TRINITY_DN8227_c0_g1~~TRINITY_DN8227_c0_g1_i2.p1  ORF type:complete len:686 (+),score=146.36 TRINITY_DN8227_c0_g1_i2:198-2255(+)
MQDPPVMQAQEGEQRPGAVPAAAGQHAEQQSQPSRPQALGQQHVREPAAPQQMRVTYHLRQPQRPAASWHRPWETNSDSSTFAMGFAASFATDVFVDLSRTFLLALRLGHVDNQPASSGEATIRMGEAYYLHSFLHSSHETVAKTIATFKARKRLLLQRLLAVSFVSASLLLVVVHLAFMCPYTQLSAARRLSEAVGEAGEWQSLCSNHSWPGASEGAEEASVPIVVRLELTEASWPREWPGNYSSLWLFGQDQDPVQAQNETNEQLLDMIMFVVRRPLEFLSHSWDLAFPDPSYEVLLGPNSATWLEVQSPAMRQALGVRTVTLQISSDDADFFGPVWARELLRRLRLYDIFVLHALPLYLDSGAKACADTSVPMLVKTSSLQMFDLSPVRKSIAMAQLAAGKRLQASLWCSLVTGTLLAAGGTAAVLMSSLLRRVLVLSCRMHTYNSLTLRKMRRFAFIAEPLRRVNSCSSTELLELWTAWGASASLLLWLLWEALQASAASLCWLLCFAAAEYWGIVHLRTLQSRWIFPRCIALLHSGALIYSWWWPLGPSWILLWSLASAQASLKFLLLCHFDCYFALPPQPPLQLMARSVLLPAVPLARSPGERPPEPLRRSEGQPGGPQIRIRMDVSVQTDADPQSGEQRFPDGDAHSQGGPASSSGSSNISDSCTEGSGPSSEPEQQA